MDDTPSEKPSLERLNTQLDALKKTQKSAPNTVPSGDAARGAIDFASASAVGIVLGFAVDYQFASSPWGLFVGLILGVAAGFRLLMRASEQDTKDGH